MLDALKLDVTNECDSRKLKSNTMSQPFIGNAADNNSNMRAMESWRRPAHERFYLGDDESDDSDDETENCMHRAASDVYGFGSWANPMPVITEDGKSAPTGASFHCRSSSATLSDNDDYDDGGLQMKNSSDSDNSSERNDGSEHSDDRHPTCFIISSDEGEETGCENIKKKLLNTSQRLVFDEDSGLGGSAPNSANEDECSDCATELVPLRVLNPTNKAKKSASHSYYNRKSPKSSRKPQFYDCYKMAEDHLGAGAYACVRTCISLKSGEEYAVKLVDKREPGHTRSRIFREVEIFKLCKNHPNIVQLVEWFEDDVFFYMVFEKMRGGQLLDHIQRKVCFTEQEASQVTRDIAQALKHLHDRGIAHRDVKPENILCTDASRVSPVKLCDLDLASKPHVSSRRGDYTYRPQEVRKRGNHYSDESSYSATSAPRNLPSVASEPDLASPVGSAEFMAPEVVDAFVGESLKYDKRCDMWSLGVIVYIMLCGYPPFYGECERENCGWDQGQACSDCQESLFHRIQVGEFDFPEEEWGEISEEAKDLICHLLVRNVRQRYTADEVLQHSWLTNVAPRTPLQTPSNLFRNDSARDMHQMNQVFQVYQHINQPLF